MDSVVRTGRVAGAGERENAFGSETSFLGYQPGSQPGSYNPQPSRGETRLLPQGTDRCQKDP